MSFFARGRRRARLALLFPLCGVWNSLRSTLCMGVPGDLYRPTPHGYNGNPAGRGSQPSVSQATVFLAGFSAVRWGPPTGGSRRLPASWPTGRPHCLGVSPAAGYCSLAPDDEGFAEVSVATVGRLGGYHCSLTSSCLLNGAPASRKGVAGFWRPATLLADWERPGRLHASLWLKGPAARGPYWRLSWVTSRSAWLQCRAARETSVPYSLL